MTKREISKVPQIRFKGFDGEWQLKTLGDLIGLENGFAFKSINFSAKPTSAIVVTPGNVKIGGGFQHGKGQFYQENVYIPDKFVFESGDIFVTMTDLTPTSQTLGFPAIVPKGSNRYLHNQRLGKLTGYHGDGFFLFYSLCVPREQKKVVSTASGTTVKHTSPSKFLNRDFCFPKKNEQAKVGAFFQELDQLIQLHQHKHDKLVALKVAMLQKMFPQPGETTPKIRFKGFNGEWVKKELGDICDIAGGGTPSTLNPEYWNGDIDWYSPTEIGKETYTSGSVKKITKLGLKNCSAKILPARKTVLFTSRAGIGDMAILNKEGCTNQGFQSLVLYEGMDTYFVYSMGYLLKSYALKYASGSTFLEVSSKQLKKMEVLIPQEKEQQRIGLYFRQIDELISLQATQLEKLKQLKVACLEKMFV